MKKIMVVFGTRPEVIKMSPVVAALRQSEFTCQVVSTAQHREMVDLFLKTFHIQPDVDLDIMQPRQTLADLTGRIMAKMNQTLTEYQPDMVLVQGDTTTVMVTALAAFYQQIPVGHVEAGLRTEHRYNPFPEEMNRRVTGQLATLHFAPTRTAAEALWAERIAPEHVFITGNTVIDAILNTAQQHPDYNVLQELNLPLQPHHKLLLVTAHRRENWGEPLRDICQAIVTLTQGDASLQVLFPVHKNPVVRDVVYPLLGQNPQVHLIEPLDYIPFMDAIRRSNLVLTDSGGIQEEAPSLGKPVLVMRTTTERPEGVAMGTAALIGTDPARIITETRRLLDEPAHYQRMSQAINPYGDGHAAERIVEALRYYFNLQAEPPRAFHAHAR